MFYGLWQRPSRGAGKPACLSMDLRPKPKCIAILHDSAHLQITGLPVGRVRTMTAVTSDACCFRHRRNTEEIRVDFIKRKNTKKTKWNQRSPELRGVPIIQGDPFLSAHLLHLARDLGGVQETLWRTMNQDPHLLSLSSTYRLSYSDFPPPKKRAKELATKEKNLPEDCEGILRVTHKDQTRNV